MSEKALMDAIMVAASKVPGMMIWRNNSGLLFTKRGVPVRASIAGAPDLIGIYRGRFIGVEVKTDTGKQEESQRRFQAACEKAGGIYILAHSFDDVMAIILSVQS